MSRKVWFVTALVLLICAAGAGVWWWRHAGELAPQSVTLPNGLTFRFAGTTYGTNHVMGPRLTMAVQRLPRPLANLARQLLGNWFAVVKTHNTSKPTLCVWFEPIGTNFIPSTTATYAMLADETGVLSGERNFVSGWGGFVPQCFSQDFSAVPRRSPTLECRLFESLPDGQYREVGRVRFPNPLRGEFPQWVPDPLPATKRAGDVEVTLESFSAGRGVGFGTVMLPGGKIATSASPAKPGEEVRATFDLSFKSPRGTNEQWAIESAELSDATGNQLRATSRSESEGRHFAISPAPWPSEHAWKLKLELERKGAFLPDELVTIPAVPVPAVGETNLVSLSNALAGVQFKRLEFRRKDDITGSSWSSSSATCIRLEHSKVPEGYSLDFVKITAPNGAKLEPLSRSWSDEHCEVTLKAVPAGVESVDITYAVQQTRTVEFLVKPELAAEDSPK